MIALRSIRQRRTAAASQAKHAAFVRAHARQERRTYLDIRKWRAPVIDRIVAALRDWPNSQPVGRLLWTPTREDEASFRRVIRRDVARMQLAGASLESQYIETATGADKSKSKQGFGVWIDRFASVSQIAPAGNEVDPDSIYIEFSPEMRAAVDAWTAAREVGIWTQISEGTQTQLARAVSDGLADGLSIDDLTKLVKSRLTHYDDVQARRVARTECLTADSFVSCARIKRIYRRLYDGPLIEIVTNAGRKLRGTPNHPVLTVSGWVALGDLSESDDLVCHRSDVQSFRSSGNQDVKHPPTTIGQLFDSLNAVGVASRKRTGKPDFHGDGMDGYVDVANVDRELECGILSCSAKRFVEFVLSESHVREGVLFRSGLSPLELPAFDKSSRVCVSPRLTSAITKRSLDGTWIHTKASSERLDGFPRVVPGRYFRDRERQSAIVVSSRTQQPSRLGLSPHYASSPDYVSNRRRVDAKGFPDGYGTLPADVEIDRPLHIVRIENFVGHVFNLETVDGYFAANEVYTSNCTGAMNNGADASMIDAETPFHEWIRTIDLRTRGYNPKKKSRFDHYHAAQVVPLADPFVVSGQRLRFPGDTSLGASAGNVCNCRCSAAAAFDGPKSPKPPKPSK